MISRALGIGLLVGLVGISHGRGQRPHAVGQNRDSPAYAARPERLAAIEAVFEASWKGYYRYAFPHDSLMPQSNAGFDDRNGWGVTAVDTLSTALIMGKEEIIDQILDFIPTIDFGKTSTEVSLFETTIRYLGGLLSAYDILKGTLKNHQPDSRVEPILDQAEKLASYLSVAFETTSGVPDNILIYDPEPRQALSDMNYLATVGTLVLEWTRLSDLTGNKTYSELVEKGESYLLSPWPPQAEPFPGLVGSRVSVTTGSFTDNFGGWGGGTDSFYEYLIKMYLYDPHRFEEYRDRWILAAESTMTFLVSHPTSRQDLTFLAGYMGTQRTFASGHLACFNGGNFIFGGFVLKEQRYIDFGLELTRACRETYVHTETGLGPELFAWQDSSPAEGDSNIAPPVAQEDFYAKAGFWIQNGQYVLRPEVIESLYHAYRATGDYVYQDWAWEAFLKINETCAVGSGYSSISGVNEPGGGIYFDIQESFWMAETLKYLWLIHAEESEFQIQVSGDNKYVYNTEAHPLRVARAAP